jgi:hypothetical protein
VKEALDLGGSTVERRQAGEHLTPAENRLADLTISLVERARLTQGEAQAKGAVSVKAYDQEPAVAVAAGGERDWTRGIEALRLVLRAESDGKIRPYEFCHFLGGQFMSRSILTAAQAKQVQGARTYVDAARAFDLFFRADPLRPGIPGVGVAFMPRGMAPLPGGADPDLQTVAREFTPGEAVFLAPNGALPVTPVRGRVAGVAALVGPDGSRGPTVLVRLEKGVSIGGHLVNTIPVPAGDVVSRLRGWQDDCEAVVVTEFGDHSGTDGIAPLRAGAAVPQMAFLTTNDGSNRGILGMKDLVELGLPFASEVGAGSLHWHPLTQDEAFCVGAGDYLSLPSAEDNPSTREVWDRFQMDICTGRTAVFQGQKWLSPVLSVRASHLMNVPENVARKQALAEAERQARYLAMRVAGINGVVIAPIEKPGLGAFEVPILLPFEWARQQGDAEGVNFAIERLLGLKDQKA